MLSDRINDFKPAWWLPSPHLQTLWGSLVRPLRRLDITRERLELPDGDFLDLGFVGQTINSPRVLILHGLNGDINSHYVNGMLHAVQQHGWRGVLMHFRGCSGEPNRLARSYHSGETGDLIYVLQQIIAREPDTPIFVIGYSLGGNVLLKALGEGNELGVLRAAAAVSVPFELAKTADHLSTGFSKIYQSHLVNNLIQAYEKKFIKKLSLKNKTFWEFDDAVTAPLHGFSSAAEYYAKSSSRQFLATINTPTLIIHALDDPFTPLDSIPTAKEVSSAVTLELTPHGGHVGFIGGKYPWQPEYWLENRVLQYFSQHLEEREGFEPSIRY